MGSTIGRLLWAFLLELAQLLFSVATADAQVVRVRGDRQMCYGIGCVMQSTYGSGTIVAHAAEYKPGKSLVLGCGHQFDTQFSALYVSGFTARLLVKENVAECDLSLIEVDYDFGKSLPLADEDLPAGAKAWVMGFGGDGVAKELPGEVGADASIAAQTRVGDSGGPVLSSKTVYGVLWGQENIGQRANAPVARFTCVRSIKRFFERHGYSRYVCRSVSRETTPDDPRPTRPAPAAGCRDPRITEAIALIDSLKAEIAALRAELARQQTISSTAGPPGQRGPAGATGSPGHDGRDGRDGVPGTVNVVIRFQGKVVDTLKNVPSGKTIIKDLDEVLSEPK